MKTLTIHQPWAWAIMQGLKDIENRTWLTKYRGRILVHAGNSRKSLPEGTQFIKQKTGILIDSHSLTFGAIIGEVNIIDVVQNSPSIWALPNHYHWVLDYPVAYDEPIYTQGQLGLFEFDLTTKSKEIFTPQLSLFN